MREALAVGPESTISNRGFRHFEAIQTDGQEIRVYESSRADSPHLWLSVTGEAFLREATRPCAGCEHGVATASVSAHMTIEQAGLVRDVLDAAIKQYYQTREEG